MVEMTIRASWLETQNHIAAVRKVDKYAEDAGKLNNMKDLEDF